LSQSEISGMMEIFTPKKIFSIVIRFHVHEVPKGNKYFVIQEIFFEHIFLLLHMFMTEIRWWNNDGSSLPD